MQRLEVSDAVRPLQWSLGVKGLTSWNPLGLFRPVMGMLYLYLYLYLYHTCRDNRPPEDEPLGSKRVEDIKN